MVAAAADVYDILLTDPLVEHSGVRRVWATFVGFFSAEVASDAPTGVIISVVRRDSGDELFRHIEDIGDDHGHLLDELRTDLATMTATDFATRWG